MRAYLYRRRGARWRYLIVLQEEVADVITDENGDENVRFAPHKTDEDYIRPIGNDVQQGQPMTQPGDTLSPLLPGALAAAGVCDINVYRRPKVGIFSSGDELRTDTPPGRWRSARSTIPIVSP